MREGHPKQKGGGVSRSTAIEQDLEAYCCNESSLKLAAATHPEQRSTNKISNIKKINRILNTCGHRNAVR